MPTSMLCSQCLPSTHLNIRKKHAAAHVAEGATTAGQNDLLHATLGDALPRINPR